jgi:hypothetical protein
MDASMKTVAASQINRNVRRVIVVGVGRYKHRVFLIGVVANRGE